MVLLAYAINLSLAQAESLCYDRASGAGEPCPKSMCMDACLDVRAVHAEPIAAEYDVAFSFVVHNGAVNRWVSSFPLDAVFAGSGSSMWKTTARMEPSLY